MPRRITGRACFLAFTLFGLASVNLILVFTANQWNDATGGNHPSGDDAYPRDLAVEKQGGGGTHVAPVGKQTTRIYLNATAPGINATGVGTVGMSACLLIKDDLNRLVEWLAYHYHILPLRHLIVAVDPTSRTSPSPVLDRWRGSGMGMEILEWSDRDYMAVDLNGTAPASDDEAVKLHRFRQLSFVYACTEHHMRMNRTWVAVVDTDEYVAFNPARNDDPKTKFKPGEREAEIAGRERDPNFLSLREQRMIARESIPSSMTGNTTIMEFIRTGSYSDLHFNEACVALPRLLYGAVEGTSEELSRARAEELGFNATKFNTLRFFRHAKKGELTHNNYAKVIADVSRMSAHSLQHLVNITGKAKTVSEALEAIGTLSRAAKSVHKPFDECKRPFTRYEVAVLRVAHYLGSWEEYSFRSDVRRSREVFEGKSKVADGSMYDMQPWLYHFVKTVGSDKAHYLLDGVGELRNWETVG